MQIVILAGGVGGSKFALGVRHAYPTARLTVIANTADDITLHGLRICPDLDTIMYTLGGGCRPSTRLGSSRRELAVMEEFAAYGVEPTWFSLGDRDIGTHLVRTQMLNAGYPLSEVTAALCSRWLAHDPAAQVATHDRRSRGDACDDRRSGCTRAAASGALSGVLGAAPCRAGCAGHHPRRPGDAQPAPGAIEALENADLILVAPSNPVVSIGPILAMPGLRETRSGARSAPVIGFAGILGGSPVLGMAHRLLPAIGVDVDAAAVGLHYGARSRGGVLDAWAMDTADMPICRTPPAGRPAGRRH